MMTLTMRIITVGCRYEYTRSNDRMWRKNTVSIFIYVNSIDFDSESYRDADQPTLSLGRYAYVVLYFAISISLLTDIVTGETEIIIISPAHVFDEFRPKFHLRLGLPPYGSLTFHQMSIQLSFHSQEVPLVQSMHLTFVHIELTAHMRRTFVKYNALNFIYHPKQLLVLHFSRPPFPPYIGQTTIAQLVPNTVRWKYIDHVDADSFSSLVYGPGTYVTARQSHLTTNKQTSHDTKHAKHILQQAFSHCVSTNVSQTT